MTNVEIIRTRATDYISDKLAHRVKFFAVESRSKKAIWFVRSEDLLHIVQTESDDVILAIFRIAGGAVHIKPQTYEKTSVIEVRKVMNRFGRILEKDERVGGWQIGEMQVAVMLNGIRTGWMKNHAADVFGYIGDERVKVEVKGVGGWMQKPDEVKEEEETEE
jgi:hypothetical protein